MDKDLCKKYPDECHYSSWATFWIDIGKNAHPYRLYAHLIVPKQKGIAPGAYRGTYSIQLNGYLRAESILGIPVVGMNIDNVQQPLEFRLNVSSACEVTPPADVTLPDQMFSGQSQSQDANATVRCTYGTPYTVAFKGANTDGGTEYLVNSNSKTKIPYQLTDESGAKWTPQGKKFTGTAENEPIHIKVQTLPGVNQPAGTYEDTVTMSVNYTDGA